MNAFAIICISFLMSMSLIGLICMIVKYKDYRVWLKEEEERYTQYFLEPNDPKSPPKPPIGRVYFDDAILYDSEKLKRKLIKEGKIKNS